MASPLSLAKWDRSKITNGGSVETEYVQWCSFCRAAQAGGELNLSEIGLVVPVCDACMDSYDTAVLPTVMELLASE